MSEDKDDKQYDASEQKLRKAREQGDIPRSTELTAALMYLGAILCLIAAGGVGLRYWLPAAQQAASPEFGTGMVALADVFDIAGRLFQISALLLMFGLMIPAAIMLVGLIVQQGIVFSPQKLAFDIKRIDPMRNAAQKFGKSGLMNFAISASKAILVGVGAWFLLRGLLDMLSDAEFMTDQQWVPGLGIVLRRVLLMALGISALFAVIDVLWKRHDHQMRNRMTRKEMEDEHKQNEGDPHLKAARRQKAIDIAMNKMLADVETADVVIVNPTHYAVALKWSRGSGHAPICVAKGMDEIAARIRERANAHKVPIWSDPPCARAIHAGVDIGDEIRPEQFAAVAAAIRFSEKMRQKARQGWG